GQCRSKDRGRSCRAPRRRTREGSCPCRTRSDGTRSIQRRSAGAETSTLSRVTRAEIRAPRLASNKMPNARSKDRLFVPRLEAGDGRRRQRCRADPFGDSNGNHRDCNLVRERRSYLDRPASDWIAWLRVQDVEVPNTPAENTSTIESRPDRSGHPCSSAREISATLQP